MRKLFLLTAVLLAQLAGMEAVSIEGRVAYLYPQDNRIRDIYGKHGYPEYQIEVGTGLDGMLNMFSSNNCCDPCANPCDTCCPDWAGFINVAYFEETGHSRCKGGHCNDHVNGSFSGSHSHFKIHNKSRIENWAINFGIKKYFCFSECFLPYVGFGVGPAHVKFNDKSHFVKRNIDRWGFALLGKLGVEYEIACNWFLDGFVDYSYNWFDKEKHKKHHRRHNDTPVLVTDDSFSGSRSHGHCGKTRGVNTGGVKVGLGVGYCF